MDLRSKLGYQNFGHHSKFSWPQTYTQDEVMANKNVEKPIKRIILPKDNANRFSLNPPPGANDDCIPAQSVLVLVKYLSRARTG